MFLFAPFTINFYSLKAMVTLDLRRKLYLEYVYGEAKMA